MNSTTTFPQTFPFYAPLCKPATYATSAVTAAELLTPLQLSRRLGISRRTLANWTRDKVLPMIKIGRVCRFDYAMVRAALAQYEQAAASSILAAASCSLY